MFNCCGGDPLSVIESPGAHPRSVGTSLAGADLDQIAGAPYERLAVVADTPRSGLGRLIWQGRGSRYAAWPSRAHSALPVLASNAECPYLGRWEKLCGHSVSSHAVPRRTLRRILAHRARISASA